MSKSRPFSYNTGSQISGTEKYGNLSVGVTKQNYGEGIGGVRWWNGPEEDSGYVIAYAREDLQQPGFRRTQTKTESAFLALTNSLPDRSGQTPFADGSSAKTWLNANGFWTSYESASIVTSNLIMELDASNYTSGTWSDESGNGNNATINGATWSSTDGGLFDLDGVNDTISIAHSSSLSLSTTVQKTIQVWVKFDSLGGSGQQIPVFGKLSSSFGFDGYWGGLFSNSGVIRCVTNGTGTQKISDSTLTVSTDTWYLMTFISQITGTSNTTKVYINTTQYISTQHGNDSYNESNILYLGYIGSGVGSLYLNGKVGACYFYTQGLSESEITQNFNATKSRYGL
jgi:hypothetical protein